MFDRLQQGLSKTIKTLTGQGKIRESHLKEALLEVRKSLLEADVQYRVVQSMVDSVRQRVLGDAVIEQVTSSQQFIKALYDEIVDVLGGETPTLPTVGRHGPLKILLVGLQGSGKTTTAAKLAGYLNSQKQLSPVLVPGDTTRLAAREQLMQLAQHNHLRVFEPSAGATSVVVCREARQAVEGREIAAKSIIFDTAGRLAIDEALMAELCQVKQVVAPDLTLYVLDAMAGQDAVRSAESFYEIVGFDGVIVTKLDGDARGGAMLSIKQTLNKPIYFVGVGEQFDDLQPLYPERMASRILGMGDIVTLVERAQAAMDVNQAEKLAQRVRKSQFTIEDFAQQLQSVKKMGSLQDLVGMLPGGAQMKQALAGGLPEQDIKRTEAIIGSMTPRERRNDQIIDGQRRKRIAAGSGTTVADVNRFLKQFTATKKMMKQFSTGGIRSLSRTGMFGMR